AEQVVGELCGAHPQTVAREGQQLAPVHAQDLDAAERPAEALLLETVEVERHHPRAVRGRVVHARVAATEHAQARLRILGDAGLAPAATSSSAERRISPMVPQKMIALRWARAGMVTSTKQRKA